MFAFPCFMIFFPIVFQEGSNEADTGAGKTLMILAKPPDKVMILNILLLPLFWLVSDGYLYEYYISYMFTFRKLNTLTYYNLKSYWSFYNRYNQISDILGINYYYCLKFMFETNIFIVAVSINNFLFEMCVLCFKFLFNYFMLVGKKLKQLIWTL